MTFGKKADTEYKLLLASADISEPEVKSTYVDVPCADGSLDYTDYFGEPKYKNRKIVLTFLSLTPWEMRHELDASLKNDLHGKRIRFFFRHDPDYYWNGRLSVGKYEYHNGAARVKITATVEPYKLKKKLTKVSKTIDGTQTIFLRNERKTVCPDITTTDTMTFVYDGKQVIHNAGDNWKLADLLIEGSGKSIQVSGNGTITFSYQEGSL